LSREAYFLKPQKKKAEARDTLRQKEEAAAWRICCKKLDNLRRGILRNNARKRLKLIKDSSKVDIEHFGEFRT
jgi:hypothetical protein